MLLDREGNLDSVHASGNVDECVKLLNVNPRLDDLIVVKGNYGYFSVAARLEIFKSDALSIESRRALCVKEQAVYLSRVDTASDQRCRRHVGQRGNVGILKAARIRADRRI